MVNLNKIEQHKPNFNQNVGIPFTYFSCNKLDPEVVNELQMRGEDPNYNSALQQAWFRAETAVENGVFDDYDEAYEEELAELDDWYDDEPCHEGELEGVFYVTSWLGGTMLLCVMDSPLRGKFAKCSPCVPGALDGDTPGDFEGFDIPEDWKMKE
jgi:hypothetical protein